jgi:bacillithiol system protein YtxJ
MEIIRTEIDVAKAVLASGTAPIVIYKHSPICGLSDTAVLEFQRFMESQAGRFGFYMLDVIAARKASLEIENLMRVRHESPQILMIWNSACHWHASHRNIRSGSMQAQADLLFQGLLN